MAGDPAFTELLLAMGLRAFSMHPSQIAAIKQQIIRADARLWASRLQCVLDADDPERACLIERMAMVPTLLHPVHPVETEAFTRG